MLELPGDETLRFALHLENFLGYAGIGVVLGLFVLGLAVLSIPRGVPLLDPAVFEIVTFFCSGEPDFIFSRILDEPLTLNFESGHLFSWAS